MLAQHYGKVDPQWMLSVYRSMRDVVSAAGANARFLMSVCPEAILIGKSGVPEAIRLIQGLGLGLDEQAARTVRAWRFRPATKAGQPISTHAGISVNFRFL